MKFMYLAILLFSIFGMTLIDYRYKLIFFNTPRAAAMSIAIVMTLLLVADIIGINWNIFSTNSRYVAGVFIGSENLPIEEFLFLFLLCYFILNLYAYIKLRTKDV
ncbi:MAG: lycopene cyclase domain-containing protein [Patescibacteria group bacterium]|nr:lycopene cyclase domain-containing protein [Patescibacteria group bacterium]